MERIFGEIEGYPEGSWFASRQELSAAGVHRPPQAGISGSQYEGADSIVLSGGYEDDRDWGDVILYTGHGGRDPQTGKQISNQMLTRQNLALAVSRKFGLPVRVIRGYGHASPESPPKGYTYAGLYVIEDHYKEPGESGYYVWRFRMRKLSSLLATGLDTMVYDGEEHPVRKTYLMTRIVRETELGRAIKMLYDYRCQVCGVRLEGNAGPYAEAAHIRPLGRPHDGPDRLENLLCLCPNHHILFDYGALAIADDLRLIGHQGCLRVHPRHRIAPEHLRYHRDRYGFDAELAAAPVAAPEPARLFPPGTEAGSRRGRDDGAG